MRNMRKPIWAVAMAVLLVLQLAMLTGAMAEGVQSETSNTLAVSELARWAQIVEDVNEEDPLPEGATRLSAVFEPSDAAFAEDSLVAIIAGSGMPEKVVLERANGWQTVAMLAQSDRAPDCMLMGVRGYTVAQGEGEIVFTVTVEAVLEEAEPEQLEEPTKEIEAYTILADITADIGPDGTVSYGDLITLSGTVDTIENAYYEYAWQYNDGNGWFYIDGATEPVYQFTLTEANYPWYYRLQVNVMLETVVEETPQLVEAADEPLLEVPTLVGE